jgi:hypothetical protein
MSTPSRYVEDRDKLTDEEYNDVFDKKLEETWDAVKAKGYSLVKGICRPGEDQGDEDDNADGDLHGADGSKKKSKEHYTKDEIDSIRCVLLTKPRLAALKKAEKMVTRNFKGWYTTHDGNEVTLDMLDCIKTAKGKRKLPDRFDAALGLTIAADSRTYWMYDNEMWGEDGTSSACTLILLDDSETVRSSCRRVAGGVQGHGQPLVVPAGAHRRGVG